MTSVSSLMVGNISLSVTMVVSGLLHLVEPVWDAGAGFAAEKLIHATITVSGISGT
jgi:hypothetical protein